MKNKIGITLILVGGLLPIGFYYLYLAVAPGKEAGAIVFFVSGMFMTIFSTAVGILKLIQR